MQTKFLNYNTLSTEYVNIMSINIAFPGKNVTYINISIYVAHIKYVYCNKAYSSKNLKNIPTRLLIN